MSQSLGTDAYGPIRSLDHGCDDAFGAIFGLSVRRLDFEAACSTNVRLVALTETGASSKLLLDLRDLLLLWIWSFPAMLQRIAPLVLYDAQSSAPRNSYRVTEAPTTVVSTCGLSAMQELLCGLVLWLCV